MALPSRLAQLQAKACEATRFAAKHGCTYQRSLAEKNKKYVVEPPTIEKCQELSKQLFYTRLARSLLPALYAQSYPPVCYCCSNYCLFPNSLSCCVTLLIIMA